MTVVLLALALGAAVLAFVGLVVIGLHGERTLRLASRPSTRLAGFTRVVLGVHIRKPAPTGHDQRKEVTIP